MTILHKDIADADLHEPKGVSTAADGKVCVAASGVGAWQFPKQQVCLDIADITAVTDYYIPFRYASNILSITTSIDGAIGTADKILTTSIAGTPITNGAVTIPYSGSAAGNYAVATPTAANAISAGTSLKIAATGATTNAVRVHVIIEYQRTA